MPRIPRPVKIVVACVLLAALAWGIDWHEMPARLARLDWVLGALAVLTVALQMPANAWKWSWSLRLHDLRFPWVYLFRTGCFGFFFNNFLPSGIGGDVYRIVRTAGREGERSRAVSAVLVERLVGLGAMLVNGLIGAVLLMRTYALARWYVQLAIAAAVALAVFAILLYFGAFAAVKRRLLAVRFLEPVWENLRRIARPRAEWLPLIATSFLFQLLAAACLYVSFAGTGTRIGIAAALLITAAAGIASVLPISVSGIGVVEGSIAGTAVALGVDYEAAVLAAIIVRVVTLPVSAACGLLYLTESDSAHASSMTR
ncbi:MAG TPA: lysylphosphatidylglycerol synthase transmembrane domain-containing protein [Steroidobacteraceae bacterium]|nr:lysylphosphatidylglycerol synthase transmembrane domain-containing protein [Steroidobacteraceae bacterium]